MIRNTATGEVERCGARLLQMREVQWHNYRFADLREKAWQERGFSVYVSIRYDWNYPSWTHLDLSGLATLCDKWVADATSHVSRVRDACRDQWEHLGSPWWLHRWAMAERDLGNEAEAERLFAVGRERAPWWDEYTLG